MKKRTVKQHYIPNKSYLNYFVDKELKTPMLWVYFDKLKVYQDSANADVKNITPINFCKESYIYETPHLPVNTIENTYAKIENDYKYVLENKIIPKKRLSDKDKEKLAYFLSTLEARTPLSKQNVNKFINQMREQLIHFEEANNNGEKSDLHKQLDQLETDNLPFVQLQLGAMDVNRFRYADFLFMEPDFTDEEAFFITSDFPVSMVDFTNMNSFYPPTPMDATVEVTIPLTPNIALFVNNIGLNGYKTIDYNFVREINNRTLRRSNQFIISPKKLSSNFTKYTCNRLPQSLILNFIYDKLYAIKHKKVERIMKASINKLTKLIVKDMVNEAVSILKENSLLENIVLTDISLYTRDNEEFNWFLDRMHFIGKKDIQNEKEISYELKIPIKTKIGYITKITICNPIIDIELRGLITYKTEINKERKEQLLKKDFTLSNIDKDEYLSLKKKDTTIDLIIKLLIK